MALMVLASCGAREDISTNIPYVSAGYATTCVMDPTRAAACWGNSVGDGTTSTMPHLDAVIPTGTGKIKSVAVGSTQDAACIINDDATRSVSCWGVQLGFWIQGAPTVIPGVSNAIDISVGAGKGCAVLVDGSLTCWTLTQGAPFNPTTVPGVSGLKQISVGNRFSCGLQTDGTVVCWGQNGSGQLGRGTVAAPPATQEEPPAPVPGISAKFISAGFLHACAALADGTARCWGSNQYGGLGDGTSGGTKISSTPQPVVGLANVERISAGWQFSCAVLSSQTAQCWGLNESGQLGNGTKNNSALPVPVTGLKGAIFISAGADHACASGLGLIPHCWGKNLNGRLTDGTQNESLIPVP